MNRQSMKRFKNNAQAGFTLIELVVVIVILGILAATALPKFTDMTADARKASVNAAKGAMSATAAMAHAKWVASGATGSASVVFEGVTVLMNSSGYPTGATDTTFYTAAGLSSTDYTISNTAFTVVPVNAKTPAACVATYAPGTGNVTVIDSGC